MLEAQSVIKGLINNPISLDIPLLPSIVIKSDAKEVVEDLINNYSLDFIEVKNTVNEICVGEAPRKYIFLFLSL